MVHIGKPDAVNDTDVIPYRIEENADQIIAAASEIVHLLMSGEDAAIDRLLFMLDDDPQWETAISWASMLSTVSSLSQWAIGDMLYFMKHRWSHETTAIFEYDGDNTPWPEGLYEFIQKRYNLSLTALLSNPENRIIDFLGWTAYQFDKFWLLVGFKEIRVWHHTGRDTPTEREWEDTIAQHFTAYLGEINEKTAWAYYAASAAWPRDRRRLNVRWTAHFELRNMLAPDVDARLDGDERHFAAGALADDQMSRWEQEGKKITPTFVRRERARKVTERRGFEWELPIPKYLTVRQIGGEKPGQYRAFVFQTNDYEFFSYIAFHVGLIKQVTSSSFRIIVRGNKLFDEKSGEIMATLENLDIEAVDLAVSALIKRLRWKVDETSV